MNASLPILGEDHPLRRKFERTFTVSATVAILVHVAAAGGRLLVDRLVEEEAISETRKRTFEIIKLPQLPEEKLPSRTSLAERVATQAGRTPIPVPDFEATGITLPPGEETSPGITEPHDAPIRSGGAPRVDSGTGTLPGAGEYVAVEEQPVAIFTPSPEYPAIARQAGVEGVVMLRVLVDEEGVVRDVIYVSGPEMLKDSAIAAVEQWKFRPALQQQHPVAVWVMVPLKFSLGR